jgi:hypothetical protein
MICKGAGKLPVLKINLLVKLTLILTAKMAH